MWTRKQWYVKNGPYGSDLRQIMIYQLSLNTIERKYFCLLNKHFSVLLNYFILFLLVTHHMLHALYKLSNSFWYFSTKGQVSSISKFFLNFKLEGTFCITSAKALFM